MPRSRAAPKTRGSINPYPAGLYLDCEDEALSTVQQSSYSNALSSYKSAVKQIEQYQNVNAIITELQPDGSTKRIHGSGGVWPMEMSPHLVNNPIHITPQEIVPTEQSTPSTSGRNRRTAAVAARKTITNITSKVLAPEEDDVIMIEPESDPSYIVPSGKASARKNSMQGLQPKVIEIKPTPKDIEFPTIKSLSKRGRPAKSTEKASVSKSVEKASVSKFIEKASVSKSAEKTSVSKPALKQTETAIAKAAAKDVQVKVPIFEYYYGKVNGSLAYREEKGQYKFKCWYCHKMLYNNVRLMTHLQGHIDSDRQQRLELSDITQCRICYKQFDTPFEMQGHMARVHQDNEDVLLCRICEKDLDSSQALAGHMRSVHTICEMPYTCQLCDFRSSVYNDVVEHFKKRHDSSKFLMCLYCLKVQEVKFHSTGEFGLTLPFYQHLLKHQAKGLKKCSACKLVFLSNLDAKAHKKQDHQPNAHVAPVCCERSHLSKADKVLVHTPLIKSVFDRMKTVSFKLSSQTIEASCKECGKPFGQSHFMSTPTDCTICTFSTICRNSYLEHITEFHSGDASLRKKHVGKNKIGDDVWHCFCGFSSSNGSVVADHLLQCSRRTVYNQKPEQKYFEYDDEKEEFNPFEPELEDEETSEQALHQVPSLFGALGLVRKKTTNDAVEVATGIVDELVNKVVPEEKTSSVSDQQESISETSQDKMLDDAEQENMELDKEKTSAITSPDTVAQEAVESMDTSDHNSVSSEERQTDKVTNQDNLDENTENENTEAKSAASQPSDEPSTTVQVEDGGQPDKTDQPSKSDEIGDKEQLRENKPSDEPSPDMEGRVGDARPIEIHPPSSPGPVEKDNERPEETHLSDFPEQVEMEDAQLKESQPPCSPLQVEMDDPKPTEVSPSQPPEDAQLEESQPPCSPLQVEMDDPKPTEFSPSQPPEKMQASDATPPESESPAHDTKPQTGTEETMPTVNETSELSNEAMEVDDNEPSESGPSDDPSTNLQTGAIAGSDAQLSEQATASDVADGGAVDPSLTASNVVSANDEHLSSSLFSDDTPATTGNTQEEETPSFQISGDLQQEGGASNISTCESSAGGSEQNQVGESTSTHLTGDIGGGFLSEDISQWTDEQLFDFGPVEKPAGKNSEEAANNVLNGTPLPGIGDSNAFLKQTEEQSNVDKDNINTFFEKTDELSAITDNNTFSKRTEEQSNIITSSAILQEDFTAQQISSSNDPSVKNVGPSKSRSTSREREPNDSARSSEKEKSYDREISRERQRQRSRSPDRQRHLDRHYRRRSRSRDRRQRSRDRSRSREKYRSRDRSRSRDRRRSRDRSRSRDRRRSRDRYRSRSKDRYHSRDRSRSRERHRSYR